MTADIIFLGILAIAAMVLFTYFKNRQAERKEERRERLLEKQEELLELLKKKDEDIPE